MEAKIAWVIALVFLWAFLFVWFRDVRRIMGERQSMVVSAASQLDACRRKAVGSSEQETADVFVRSHSIYRQAVDIYNQTLKRPWVYLPARIMGYHALP